METCKPRRWHCVWATIVALVAVVAWARPTRASTCEECHRALNEEKLRAPAEAFRGSVHDHEEVGCVACHGGDGNDPTARAHGDDTGFTARPAREAIVAICGGCHGDARLVRRFNASLPIDQLSLYQLSRHGRQAAKGDEAAPVCTTCHGTHGIRPVRDPRSEVHPTRVAELCGQCHADHERMKGSNLPTTQLAGYLRSAHAAALAAGDLRAPSCAGCHGGHGELPAKATAVGQVCRGCHAEALASFSDSPHSKPFRRMGLGECVPCHGSHDVPVATPSLLSVGADGACGHCHARDDKPQAVMNTLVATLSDAGDVVARARARAARAMADGLRLPAIENALVELRTAELQLGPRAHALDPGALEAPAAEVRAAAAAVERLVDEAEARRRGERVGASVAIALLSALTMLLVAKAVVLARRRARGQ